MHTQLDAALKKLRITSNDFLAVKEEDYFLSQLHSDYVCMHLQLFKSYFSLLLGLGVAFRTLCSPPLFFTATLWGRPVWRFFWWAQGHPASFHGQSGIWHQFTQGLLLYLLYYSSCFGKWGIVWCCNTTLNCITGSNTMHCPNTLAIFQISAQDSSRRPEKGDLLLYLVCVAMSEEIGSLSLWYIVMSLNIM